MGHGIPSHPGSAAEHIVFSSNSSSGASGASETMQALPPKAGSKFPAHQSAKTCDGAVPSEESAPVVGGSGSSWSVGAQLHAVGKCRPCAWHRQMEGCANGSGCPYCHMCDKG